MHDEAELGDELHIETFDRGSLPEDALCRHEIVRSASGIQLVSGLIQTKGSCEWLSASPEGLMIGVARGRMTFDLGRRWTSELFGSYGFCLSTTESIETRHVVPADVRLQSVMLHVPAELLEQFRISHGELAYLRSTERTSASFRNWQPDRRVIALVHQILDCRYRGALRTLYLQGKSLEFFAMTLDTMDGSTSCRGRARLSPGDVERLRQAHDHLIDVLDSPPSLDALARHCGMSVSRLTSGFRQIYAMSVTEFIQERRLDRALTSLTEGGMTVAQAAFQVGYSPAYFSTLFRRKFGFPPSAIASRSH